MTVKEAKDDYNNKNKAGSSSLPFEIRERAKNHPLLLQLHGEEKKNSKDLAKKGLKHLSAQKNLTQC
jgi:hypothetical protein